MLFGAVKSRGRFFVHDQVVRVESLGVIIVITQSRVMLHGFAVSAIQGFMLIGGNERND